jgi:hypothetical protein
VQDRFDLSDRESHIHGYTFHPFAEIVTQNKHVGFVCGDGFEEFVDDLARACRFKLIAEVAGVGDRLDEFRTKLGKA